MLPPPSGEMSRPVPLFRKKLKKRSVAEIFFQIRVVVQIFCVNFRHGKPVLAKMPRKCQKRDVFLTSVIENSDCADLFIADPYELASRAAELAVKRLRPRPAGEWKCCSKSFFRTSIRMPTRL